MHVCGSGVGAWRRRACLSLKVTGSGRVACGLTATPHHAGMNRVTPTIGVEVDGEHVTAVLVQAGQVRQARTVLAGSSASPIATALEGFPSRVPVRVAVASAQSMSTSLVALRDLRDRAAVLNAVREEFSATRGNEMPGLCLAASLASAGSAQGAAILGCAMPAVRVQEIVSDLTSATGSSHVVPSTLLAAGAGSWVLAVRRASVEVIYGSEGRAIASEVLDRTGLDGLEAQLGLGDAVGAQRLNDAMQHGGLNDPTAGLALERWLEGLIAQALTTRTTWLTRGYAVPEALTVVGPGAAARVISSLLEGAEIPRAALKGSVAGALLDVEEHHSYVGAYLAAAHAGDELQLAGNFLDAAAEAEAARRRRRGTLLRRATQSAAAVVIVLAAALGPALALTTYVQAELEDETKALAARSHVTLADAQAALDAASAQHLTSAHMDDVAALAKIAPKATIDVGNAGATLTARVGTSAAAGKLSAALAKAGFSITSTTLVPDGTGWNASWQVTR